MGMQMPKSETGPDSKRGKVTAALARRGMEGPVSIQGKVLTQRQMDLLTRTVCKGASPDEFALFIQVANRTGLDPFTRQIHAVRRYDSRERREVMTIQTGIDGYRLVAQRSGQFAGSDDYVYDTESEPRPGKAACTVYKVVQGVRCPVTRSARWDEFAQTYYDRKSKQRRLTPLWAKMPFLMLGKCAEAQALRAAFPMELSGIYTTEEMDQADTGPLVEPDGSETETVVQEPSDSDASGYGPEDGASHATPPDPSEQSGQPGEGSTTETVEQEDVDELMEPSVASATAKVARENGFTGRKWDDLSRWLLSLSWAQFAHIKDEVFPEEF